MQFKVTTGQCQKCPQVVERSQQKTVVCLDNGAELSLCRTHFRVSLWFDGCIEPKNPGGHASYGCVVEFGGLVVQELAGYVGCGPEMSNQVAEYSGLLAGLRWLAEVKLDRLLDASSVVSQVVARGDSKMVVEQMSGRWKAKGGLYLPYYRQAWDAAGRIRGIEFEWVPRAENTHADRLSKDVLRAMGVEFRLQPE